MALHRKIKNAFLGFLFIAFAVGFSLVASVRYAESKKEQKRLEQERGELRPPEPYAVPVKSRALVLKRSFAVDIAPWISARVPAEVAGRVINTFVEVGQQVGVGDPLIEIDSRRAHITLEEAEARYAEALRLLSEAERLRTTNVVSPSQREAVASEARIATARLEEARDHVARHMVRAPFDGVINQRLVDEGDAVSQNEPVVVLVDVKRLRVKFDVSASDLSAFIPGKAVAIRPGLPRAAERQARVAFVSPAADPATRLFRIEAELANQTDPIPGGLHGTIEAEVAVFPEGPVLPAAAVRFSGKAARVLVPNPSALEKRGPLLIEREIVVGPEVDGYYPVLSGIAAGESIFIR